MKFRDGDTLLSASVVDRGSDAEPADEDADEDADDVEVTDGPFVFVVTEGGYAKRTAVSQYRVQGRNGYGILVAKLTEARGELAGALIVEEDDEVLAVLASGKVIRSAVAEVPAKGRNTMGVKFAQLADDDRIIQIARNSERNLASPDSDETEPEGADAQNTEASSPDAAGKDDTES
jgi:DNA gyrase subunit A